MIPTFASSMMSYQFLYQLKGFSLFDFLFQWYLGDSSSWSVMSLVLMPRDIKATTINGIKSSFFFKYLTYTYEW
jgi:hypothetical protein